MISIYDCVCLSTVVMVQVTEEDYRSSEQQKQIPVVVNKNVRLANPITLLLTPFNESEANSTGQPLPANIPPNDNPLSTNRAKCKTVLCIVCPPPPPPIMFSYSIGRYIPNYYSSLYMTICH